MSEEERNREIDEIYIDEERDRKECERRRKEGARVRERWNIN